MAYFGAEKNALHIDGHDTIPGLRRLLLDRYPRHGNPGIVDEDIEPAMPLDGNRDGIAPILFQGHIEMDIEGFLAARPKLGLKRLALIIENVAEHDPGALAHEDLDLFSTQTPRAPADDCHLAGQPPHFRASSSFGISSSVCMTACQFFDVNG